MSNEKKNPLIGAFRTPVAGAPPTSAPPIPAKETKPPILSPAAVKPGEVKKPAEPAKDDKAAKDGKPTAPPVTPAKPDEAKKSAEPAKDDKATKDSKPAVAPVAPAKADEVKKPIEPVKDDKAVKADKPAVAPVTPAKPDEAKKSAEPAKDDKATKDSKPAVAPVAPAKADEVMKPIEPVKDDKAVKADKPTAPPVTPTKSDEMKKSSEPAKDDKAVKDGKPAAAPIAPTKPDEVKKSAEPAKDDKATKDGKPAVAPVAPAKADEVKKPIEPAKDDKAVKADKPAMAPVTPTKPDEMKKPAEPVKDDKAAKDGKPAAAPSAPVKPDETKKPAEPAKGDKAVKADKPAAVSAASTKPTEVKKPDEPAVPQKSPEQSKDAAAATRTADGPKGSAVTKVFEDRLDAPAEADFFKLPVPNEGEIYSMAVHPAYLKDFLDHPFTVNRETQDYKDLFESIKNYGIREPVLCRPGRNGGLEIISGHRRHDIGAQLNYPIPVLIERVDEDDAQIQCVDGNLHRKDIPISELARAAQMKMDALKRKAGRRSKADILAGKAPMKRSDEQVGEDLGMSRASVQRLMRVNQLEEPLKKMVDKKELPLDTAEQISHMKPAEQKTLVDAIEKEGGKVPSKTEATKLKEESRAGTLTPQKIEKSVAPTKREVNPPLKVTFQDDELRPYFPDEGTTVATVKRTMFEALDLRKRAIERQKARDAEKSSTAKKPPTPTR